MFFFFRSFFLSVFVILSSSLLFLAVYNLRPEIYVITIDFFFVICLCRAPVNLSRLQAAAAGAQRPGSDVAPLHGRSGEPAGHKAEAPADTSDPLQLLWSVTDFILDLLR